jgi:hypothetical protein
VGSGFLARHIEPTPSSALLPVIAVPLQRLLRLRVLADVGQRFLPR